MSTLYSLGAVTIADYRVQTGDTTGVASAVSAALVEAEGLIEDVLRRKLASQERTGTFKIYQDGKIYPDAYPVSSSALEIWGRALLGAAPDGGPFVGVWSEISPPLGTVTWTGGYTAPDGAYPLPATLRRGIYALAKALQSASPTITGATSVSLGDASITRASPTSDTELDAYVPGLTRRLAPYRNRWL